MMPQTFLALALAMRALLPGDLAGKGDAARPAGEAQSVQAHYEPEAREVSNWRHEAMEALEPKPIIAMAALFRAERPFVTRCVKLNNYWCIKSARWNDELATDGEGHVGFVSADRLLKRVSLSDGLVVTLARDADYYAGAVWGADDRITFGRADTIWQVSGSGGEPTQLTTLDHGKGEIFHAWPTLLPGGKTVLFASVTGSSRDATHIEAMSLADGKRSVIVESGTFPLYAPSGHLIFFGDGALIKAKGKHDCWDGTTTRQQGQHDPNQPERMLEPEQRSAAGLGKGFGTGMADIPTFFDRMDANAFACATGWVGAYYQLRTHRW